MPEFNSNGVNLFYEDIGEGKPLLLFHGLTSNHKMFYREIGYFKDKYRIIALDSRGHGNSERPEDYTLADHIEDAAALLDHLGLESVYVIGVSMGSYIAQGLAIRKPDRVKKLILAATKSFGEKSSMAELFDRHEEDLRGLNLIDKFVHSSQYIYHNQEAVEKWIKKTAEDSKQLTMKEQAVASDALKQFDFQGQLKNITAETLVISGKYDGLNPPDKGRETVVLIPNADYMEFNESGHAPNVEQDRLFLGVVEKFLE